MENQEDMESLMAVSLIKYDVLSNSKLSRFFFVANGA